MTLSLSKITKTYPIELGETVTAGKVVELLHSGRISSSKSSILEVSTEEGNVAVPSPSTSSREDIKVVELNQEKIFVMYKAYIENKDVVCAKVISVESSSITVGDETIIMQGNIDEFAAAKLTENKLITAFTSSFSLYHGTLELIEIDHSNLTITVLPETNTEFVSTIGPKKFDLVALSPEKCLILYAGEYYKGTAKLAYIRNNVITFNESIVFHDSATNDIRGTLLGSREGAPSYTNVLIVYAKSDYTVSAVVLGILEGSSGDSMEVQTPYDIMTTPAATFVTLRVVALSPYKALLIYRDNTNMNSGALVLSITYGYTTTIQSEGGQSVVLSHDEMQGACVKALTPSEALVTYRDTTKFKIALLKIDDTTITIEENRDFSTENRTEDNALALLKPDKAVIFYNGPYDNGYASIISINATKKIGIAQDNLGLVLLRGTSNVHSNLIPGAIYYADENNNLTTERTPYRVGIARSDTELWVDQFMF